MQAMVEQVNFRGSNKRKITTVGGYALAKKRNVGQCAADTLVKVCAGDAINGGVKDRHIVTRFEHRAALAHRVVSKQAYAQMAEAVPEAEAGSPPRIFDNSSWAPGPCHFDVHGFCGDATNQEACDKEKPHIAE
eukprot:7616767-Pyramimonas_sp.AAC.1